MLTIRQLWAASVETSFKGGHQIIWIIFTGLALVWWNLTLRLTPHGPSIMLDLEPAPSRYDALPITESKQANGRKQVWPRFGSLETLVEEIEDDGFKGRLGKPV